MQNHWLERVIKHRNGTVNKKHRDTTSRSVRGQTDCPFLHHHQHRHVTLDVTGAPVCGPPPASRPYRSLSILIFRIAGYVMTLLHFLVLFYAFCSVCRRENTERNLRHHLFLPSDSLPPALSPCPSSSCPRSAPSQPVLPIRYFVSQSIISQGYNQHGNLLW